MKNFYQVLKEAIGDESSILRRFSSSYRKLEQQNNEYKARLKETETAAQRSNETIKQLESIVESNKLEYSHLQARLTTAEEEFKRERENADWLKFNLRKGFEYASNLLRNHKGALHWKRDVVQAGQALLQTSAELEAMKSGRAVVIAANHNDRITYASPRALKLLGYSLDEIEKQDVYSLLKGTDKKNPDQIKYATQTEIMQNRPDKIPLPDAQLIRSGARKPVGANLTILPVYAGTTYIGTIIRGESKEEKRLRLNKQTAAKKAKEAQDKTITDAEKKRSKSIIEEALAMIRLKKN